jgi:tRNA(adenine34) deaminase
MKRVVIGAMNPKAGCAGSIINLLDMDKFNHKVEVETGIRSDECSNLLKEFFANLRKKKSEVKGE